MLLDSLKNIRSKVAFNSEIHENIRKTAIHFIRFVEPILNLVFEW